MSEARDVALVLLAAGTSTRFGHDDKLLADLAGRRLIDHCIDRLAEFDFGERVAVVRRDTETASRLGAAGYRIIVNSAPEDGIGTSLSMGVSAIEASASCLICLADMPLITTGHIRAILEADGDIVASSRNGINQPPARFSAAHFRALEKLSGDFGARALIRSANAIACAPEMLADVDTPGDLISAHSALTRAAE